jgi:hypothetical protein
MERWAAGANNTVWHFENRDEDDIFDAIQLCFLSRR